MEFNKYSYYDETVTIGSFEQQQSSNNNNSGGDIYATGGHSTSRTIWGQSDIGSNDIDEDLKCEGNIYCYSFGDDVDDVDYTKPDHYVDDDISGMIYADELLKSGNRIEGREIYATESLYIPHPTTGVKTDIIDLLTDYNDRISANETNIANLTTTVNNHTTQINNHTTQINNLQTSVTNLTTTVTNNTTNITTNTNDITDIKNRLDNLDTTTGGTTTDLTNLTTQVNTNTTNITDLTTRVEALENAESAISEYDWNYIKRITKYGDYSHPIALYAGVVRKSTVNNSNYWFVDGPYNDRISVAAGEAPKGVLTITLTPWNGGSYEDTASVVITSVNVTQLESDKLGTDPSVDDNKGRSTGAHWFAAFFANNSSTDSKVYIREFHQGNGDNDTWYNDNWPALKKVNVVVYGYVNLSTPYSLMSYDDEPTPEDDAAREAMEREELAAMQQQTDQTE